MIDLEAKIRAYLIARAEITAIFGRRVYASRSLPAGYRPEQGPALLFTVRGGRQAYHAQLFSPSVQFRAYAKDDASATHAGRMLHESINDRQAHGLAYIRMEDGTLPTLLNDPETSWPYSLSFYTFHVQNQ